MPRLKIFLPTPNFIRKFINKILCPIYECTVQKGVSSCKECGKAPCELWLSTRNPDFTDEEFQADIDSRLKNFEEQL